MGLAVGFLVGTAVGNLEGTSEGTPLGRSVGAADSVRGAQVACTSMRSKTMEAAFSVSAVKKVFHDVHDSDDCDVDDARYGYVITSYTPTDDAIES